MDQGALFEVHVPIVPGQSIYVIGEANSSVVKIGKASNVKDRLGGIQTSNPRRLVVRWRTPGGRPLEARLHERFGKFRMVGEWFDFGMLDPVAEIRAAVLDLTGHAGPEPDRVMPNGDLRHRRLNPDRPEPHDPDFADPRFQRQCCGCRRLTPTECVEQGSSADDICLIHTGVPDEGYPSCLDNH